MGAFKNIYLKDKKFKLTNLLAISILCFFMTITSLGNYVEISGQIRNNESSYFATNITATTPTSVGDWYMISTPGNLAYIFSNSSSNYGSYKLTCNIDLYNCNWTSKNFYGVLDGCGFSIKNYSSSNSSSSTKNCSFIANNYGTIMNLNFDNASISYTYNPSSPTDEVRTRMSPGIITNVNSGTIKNCNILQNCSITGTVDVGGIAGMNRGTITGCTNYGEVKTYRCGGGIAGSSSSKIDWCTNRGTVGQSSSANKTLSFYIGGIVGWIGSSATLVENMNYGAISSSVTSGDANYLGGICGYSDGVVIRYSGNYASVTGNKYVGGICGFTTGSYIDYSVNTGNITGGGGKVGGIAGQSYQIDHCYNEGKIDATSSSYMGGIVGYSTSSVYSCLNVGTIAKSYTTSTVESTTFSTIKSYMDFNSISVTTHKSPDIFRHSESNVAFNVNIGFYPEGRDYLGDFLRVAIVCNNIQMYKITPMYSGINGNITAFLSSCYSLTENPSIDYSVTSTDTWYGNLRNFNVVKISDEDLMSSGYRVRTSYNGLQMLKTATKGYYQFSFSQSITFNGSGNRSVNIRVPSAGTNMYKNVTTSTITADTSTNIKNRLSSTITNWEIDPYVNGGKPHYTPLYW